TAAPVASLSLRRSNLTRVAGFEFITPMGLLADNQKRMPDGVLTSDFHVDGAEATRSFFYFVGYAEVFMQRFSDVSSMNEDTFFRQTIADKAVALAVIVERNDTGAQSRFFGSSVTGNVDRNLLGIDFRPLCRIRRLGGDISKFVNIGDLETVTSASFALFFACLLLLLLLPLALFMFAFVPGFL